MEKLKEEFEIEPINIQVNQNELESYSKILLNHNKLLIRVINENITINTKSFFKIMNLVNL